MIRTGFKIIGDCPLGNGIASTGELRGFVGPLRLAAACATKSDATRCSKGGSALITVTAVQLSYHCQLWPVRRGVRHVCAWRCGNTLGIPEAGQPTAEPAPAPALATAPAPPAPAQRTSAPSLHGAGSEAASMRWCPEQCRVMTAASLRSTREADESHSKALYFDMVGAQAD